MMKRALGVLIAAARVRWLQAQGRWQNSRLAQGDGRRARLANIAEGTHDGNLTKFADAAITERYLIGKVGSNAERVAVAGAGDAPLGVITDEATAMGDPVNVALLGSNRGTLRMVASGAIAQGALVEPTASGRIQTLGASAGIHHIVGRALDAALGAGDAIEVDAFYCLRVI